MTKDINIAEVDRVCKRCANYLMCLRRYNYDCANKKAQQK